MAFVSQTSRYVPHSDTTRGHYERLLLDLRRCLPPGVDDDLEDIAEETLAIVCAGVATGEGAQEQQGRLERLLDTKLTRETRDRLLQYGRLIDDFVVDAGADDSGRLHGAEGGGKESVLDNLNYYEAPMSSSSSDDEEKELALLSGMPTKKRKKALREDKNLAQYAFQGDDTPFLNEGGPFDADGDVGFEDGTDGMMFGAEKPKIAFDEVICNPQYIKDSLRRLFPAQDSTTCEAHAIRVVEYLSQRSVDQLELETQLTAYLGGYDDEAVMDWIGDLTSSRWSVVYGLRYARCETQGQREKVVDSMQSHGAEEPAVERLYQEFTGKEISVVKKRRAGAGFAEDDAAAEEEEAGHQAPLREIDLQACAFQDERSPHQHIRATVPQGTQRIVYDTHDEVTLPPSQQLQHTDPLVPVSSFPDWAQPAFHGMESLNSMQSKVYSCAFLSNENTLVSAPTGAGKTNVAMMAMLRAVENSRNPNTGQINLHDLTMVYVAPMKALVQEVVRTFSARLELLGLTVAELSGDSAMTQQQMLETQLIVTTPEKWDIVTRKSVELGVASLIKLLIIDEVHLLHNERGPVLEAIVARTVLQQQLRGEAGIRLVGLSATLPNYEDVATFLQVDRQRGLFVFDSSYRPIPLEQTFCAIKKIKGMNQSSVMNRIVYDKVLQTMQDNEQVMIFVHSRKETEHTATYLRQRALEENRRHLFVRPGGESEQVLRDTVAGMDHDLRRSLQQLIPFGFGIHHAGLSREERKTVEELFGSRHLRVLVCTSTLAWGVNLPANRVVIKGTRVFNGSKGESELLSALDVLQMFGRAGRVGFGSTVGRAVIITSAEDLHYYLCVLSQQLPIESQMMKRVVDMLNAEITLGHVESTREGVQWLQRTYLYVRMRKVPEVYGIRPSASDPLLLHHLENIVHTACERLRGSRMADYDPHSRRIGSTPYGRIASYCYVTAASMAVYLSNLTAAMQDVDLFRVFSMSSEFAHISVRTEEQAQLKELLESAPVAVRESRYTPLAKINVLLQCYISRKDLEGLPLMSELVYIKDSAQRILRALYEICLVREYGRTSRQFLELYAMVLHRQWSVQSPIRQVQALVGPKDFGAILPALERVRVPWEEVRRWTREDLAEKLNDDRRAEAAHDCVRHVPHYIVDASVRPLTRGMLYVDVELLPDFIYNDRVHGRSVRDLLLTIEHTNGRVLHHEMIQLPISILRAGAGGAPYPCAPIIVPMVDPRPTYLFVRCTSPNWLGTAATAAVQLLNTRLPAVAAPLREMHQRPPTERTEDHEVSDVLGRYALAAAAAKVFRFDTFTPLQSDIVEPIMETQDSILVGVPPGGGKTVLAELLALQFLLECALDETQRPQENAEETGEAGAQAGAGSSQTPMPQEKRLFLYLTCHSEVADRRYMEWSFKFGEGLGQRVARLDRRTPDSVQSAVVRAATILITTGADLISWVRRADPQLLAVTHICVDHLHSIRAVEGLPLEECLARLNAAPLIVGGVHRQQRARLLALTYPLISCAEVGKWLRIPAAQQYNYGTSYRRLRVRMDGMELPGARSRYEAGVVSALKLLQRPAYAAAPAVVFVPTAGNAEEVARRVLLRCRGVIPKVPIGDPDAVDDARLGIYLAAGVAYLHQETSDFDLGHILTQLEQPAEHEQGPLPLILVCAMDSARRLPAALFTTAIVCAAERGVTTSRVAAPPGDGDGGARECTVAELLLMASRAANEAVVHCRASRCWVWGKLLGEPLPLESGLCYPDDFRDAVNAAVAQGRVRVKTDVLRVLKSHYFLNHLLSNLHFYGVPSAEDVPLYASDFAVRVLASLQELGCVVVEEGTDEDSDDPLAPVRPTARGVAVAHHCISMNTVEAVSAAVEAGAPTGKVHSVAGMWGVVAAHSLELGQTFLGDAARVADSTELQALHTIARTLPTQFGVHYVDLDFSSGHIKVQLLVLAHCARFFAAPPIGALHHPFEQAEVPAEVLPVLLAIPVPVAARLQESLEAALPTVRRVVAAVAGLLPPSRAQQMRYLMHLTQCLHRRVWTGEGAVVQLPTVQSCLQRLGGAAVDPASVAQEWRALELRQIQEQGTAGAREGLLALLKKTFPAAAASSISSTLEGSAAAICAEADHVPLVTALQATGSVTEVEGTLALAVEVKAQLRWRAGPPTSWLAREVSGQSREEPTATGEEEVARRWWVVCQMRPKGSTGQRQARLLSMRVVEVSSDDVVDPTTVSSAYTVGGTLIFPLTSLEEEAEDLDSLEVSAVVASSAFRVDAETTVLFASPPQAEE